MRNGRLCRLIQTGCLIQTAATLGDNRQVLKILSEPPFLRSARPGLPFVVTVTTLGSMPLHLFLPALPATAQELATSPSIIQLTITLYIAGLAIGQPVYGPLSDRYGRRPMLMAGLVLFVVASIVAAFTTSAAALIAARVFQALGACGGLVLGRSMVRDGTTTERAAGTMATLGMALTIAPAIGPTIGAYLSDWLGWRAVFIALALVGIAMLIITLLTVPETHWQRSREIGFAPMLRNYQRLLRMPQFLGHAVAGSVSAVFYACLTVLPFVMVDVLHRSLHEVGLYYLVIVVGNGLGSFGSKRLVGSLGSRRLARMGIHVQLAAATLMLLIHFTGTLGVISFIGAATVLSLGVGLCNPNAMVNAISADATAIGAASGLYGSMQMAFGALATGIVGAWHSSTVLPLAVVMLLSALVGQAALSWAERQSPSTAH